MDILLKVLEEVLSGAGIPITLVLSLIRSVLQSQEARQRLERLLTQVAEDFRQELERQGLKDVAEWVTQLPFHDLDAFLQALEALLKYGDEQDLRNWLKQEFVQIPGIHPEELVRAQDLYLYCLRRRLLADPEFHSIGLALSVICIEHILSDKHDLVPWPQHLERYLEELERKAEFFTWQVGKTKRDVAVPMFVTRSPGGEKIPWDRFLQEHRRILLTGLSGAGKTFAVDVTILKLIDQARDCIREKRIKEAPIPVLLTSGDLPDDRRQISAKEAVRKHLGREPESWNNLWVFVDDVAEFSEKIRKFVQELDHLLGEGGRLILVAAKPPILPVLADVAICEPAPLPFFAQQELIIRLVGTERLVEILKGLRRSPYLRELCSHPLLLTLYCLTGKSTQTESLRTILYEFLERKGKPSSSLAHWSKAVFLLFKENPGHVEFSRTAAFENEVQSLQDLGLARVSEHSLSFVHSSFVFYLAGLGWAHEFTRASEDIRQRLRDRRWDPVWPFLAGHLAAMNRASDVAWLVEEIAEHIRDWSEFKTREDLEAALAILLQCLWEGKVSPIPEPCRDAIVQAIDVLQQRSWDDQWERIHCWPWWGIALEMLSGLARPIRGWVRNWVYQVVKGAPMSNQQMLLKLVRSVEELPDPLVRWSLLWVAAAWKDLIRQYPIVYTKWRERLLDRQEHPAVRALVARALAHHRYQHVDRALAEILHDLNTPALVKVAALRGLGRLARDDPQGRAERVRIICENLDSKDPLVLQGAIHALMAPCHHCSADQKASFLKRAPEWLTHPYPPVRSGAASLAGQILKRPEYRDGEWRRACCQLEPAERQRLFEALVGALSDSAVTVRRSAAWALGHAVRWCPCGRELRQHREALVQRFKEEMDPGVVKALAKALIGLEDTKAAGVFLEALRDPFKVQACFWALMILERKDRSIENAFSRALEGLPPETLRALYEPIHSHENPDWALRLSLRVMKARPGAHLISPLLGAWRHALAQKSGQRYQPDLWKQFSQTLLEAADDPDLRAWVIPVLVQMYAGPEDLRGNVEAWVQERLRSWLEDQEPQIRKAAWQALQAALDRRSAGIPQNELQEILRRALNEENLEFRKEILLVAERIRFRIAELKPFLNDRHGSVRAAAVGLMVREVRRGKIPPPVEEAKRLLRDPDPKVRASAAGLAEVLLPRVQGEDRDALLEALISLLSDRSWDVQKSAIVALDRNAHLLGERLEHVAAEVEKKLHSSDPDLQAVALGFLTNLASRGYRPSWLNADKALKLLEMDVDRSAALWHLGSQTEWMRRDKTFWRVYKQIRRLVQGAEPGGPVQSAELASALFVLSEMLEKRRDLTRAFPDPEWWIRRISKLLDHPDPRVSRNAMGLLGIIGRYHELEEEVLQRVVESAWRQLSSENSEDQAFALYVLQADALLRRIVETNEDFPERLKNIVLKADPKDKVLATALWVLQRPAAWESLTEPQKAEILGRCLDLLDHPQRRYIGVILGTLAKACIVRSLPDEGRRRVVERVLGWVEAPDVPANVLCSVLSLLRKRLYWQLVTEIQPSPEGLLARFLNCSDDSLQALLLGMLLEDHVWNSLPPQFQEQALERARQLSGSRSLAVRRNALWVCVRRSGEGQEGVRRLLESPNSKDLIVAVHAAGELADRWDGEALRVMKRLWELMGSPVSDVATLAWPAYARILERIEARERYMPAFINRAHEVLTKETRHEVLYGVLEGLIELAHRLEERDRRWARAALRDWLRDSREKIRIKAAFLMALIGEPAEVAEALTMLGVPQEGIPEDIAERRQFLRRVLEAREEEL
jgi:hypothetical protein